MVHVVLVLHRKLLVMINEAVRILYVRSQNDKLSQMMGNAKTVYSTLTPKMTRKLVFQIKIHVVIGKGWM